MMASFEFDPEFAGPQSWAAMYRRLRWQLVPAKDPREVGEGEAWKRPVVKWEGLEGSLISDADFAGWFGPAGKFRNRANMGAITGDASERLWVIDTDTGPGKDGEAIWRGWLAVHNNGMELECPTQRTGGGGRQRFFKAPEGYSPPTFKTANGLDSRGSGGFAMLPPSLHESGRNYEWEPGLAPWEVDTPDAPPWLIEEADKLAKLYVARGANGSSSPAIGQTQNAFGLTVDGREERMRDIVWGVACDLRRALPNVSDPTLDPLAISECERAWGLYLFEVKTTIGGVPNEEGLEREGRGRSAFNERWLRALAQWNGKLATEAAQPKPAPRPKDEAAAEGFDPFVRTEYPAFPMHCLPAVIRAFVAHQAATVGVDPAGMAMAVLTAASGALDQRFRLRMSADWHVPPRLWTVLVGGSSTKKTPIITAASAPLARLEHQWAQQRATDWARYEALKEAGEKSAPKPPPATRLILNSTTIEAAGALLAQQPRGLLMLQDEMSGFIGSFDRYSNSQDGGDRGFWLNAYDGGQYHVDRREAGKSLVIENFLIAFLAGVQPARLQEFERLTSDGLLQRFNPIMIRRGGFPQDVETGDIPKGYGDILSYIAQMKPITFRLSAEALEIATEFRRELYDLEGEFEDDDSGFCAWLGKLAATFGSLMLVLHVLGDKENCSFAEVGRETAAAALEICRDFLFPHALTFYQEVMGMTGGGEQKRIAGYLLTAPRTRFTYADLRANGGIRKVRSQLEMSVSLAPFVTAGWLAEEGDPPHVAAWNLAPWVRERFAAERDAELARRAKRASRFKPKGGK